MKKLIAVAVLSLMAAAEVNATAIPTRVRFRPYNAPCWSNGTMFDGNGGSSPIADNNSNTYTVPGNGSMFLYQSGNYTCCDGGPVMMGYTWQEWQDPSGSWHLSSPTFVPVYLPAGSMGADYWVQNGVLTQGTGITFCH